MFEDGRAEAHLIRPAPGWTDWDPLAEAVHGVARERLEREGEPHDAVARRVLAALGGHEVYATAPSWDGHWLSLLLRSAGLPRHALRLKDSDEAHLAAALEVLGPDACDLAAELIARARAEVLPETAAHRALADAQAERQVWLEVRRLARAATGAA